ncbi:MAG: ATPase [Oscillospiraceae bacterium]|nr:ATPase [Oscillospiraceae bacterium]
MNIHEILDSLDETLDKSWSFPFSNGKSLIDIDKIRNLIGDIRINMPTEIKQARMIVEDRKQIIEDSKIESDIIIRKAEERAKAILNKDEIVKRANEKALEMINSAHAHTKELKLATNDFVNKILKESEDHMMKNIDSIKVARATLNKSK